MLPYGEGLVDPDPVSQPMVVAFVLTDEVAITDGGEADKGVVHAVHVRPAILDVVEYGGGQHKEQRDPWEVEAEQVEQELTTTAVVVPPELVQLENVNNKKVIQNLSLSTYKCKCHLNNRIQ